MTDEATGAARSGSSDGDELRIIAERLHDGPIQNLTAAGLWLVTIRRQITDPAQSEILETIQRAVTHSIGNLRAIMDELGAGAEMQVSDAPLSEQGGRGDRS